METSILPQIILIGVLILINAFFAAAEMAIVSINKNKLKILIDSGNKKAIMLDKLIDEPSRLLSTIQIGITFAGYFASASATVSLSELLLKYLMVFNLPYAKPLSIIIITILLAYVNLVFGELVPKRIALQKSEQVALSSIGIIMLVYKIFIPFIKILSISTNIVLKLSGMDINASEDAVSKEEIKSLVQEGKEKGIINDNESEMIEKIIEFDEKIAREIMIPRTIMYAIDIESSIEELFSSDKIIQFSRIPVYEKELDNIIGILHTKDLLKYAYTNGFDNISIRDIIKEANFVPDTKNVNSLFNEMKKNQAHMYVLMDEYGGVSGIITLEDILEEVVGEIDDEYDKVDKYITKLSNNKYLVNGELSLNDFNDHFELELESKHYDSMSGFLIEHLGYIPKENEEIADITIENIVFKIQKIKNKKISKIITIFQD